VAGVRRLLECVAPEPDLEETVQPDTDPLQRVHVEPGHAPLDPPDDVPAHSGALPQRRLGPGASKARLSNLSADPDPLVPTASHGLDRDGRPPRTAHVRRMITRSASLALTWRRRRRQPSKRLGRAPQARTMHAHVVNV
jgi:hypothetical protein